MAPRPDLFQQCPGREPSGPDGLDSLEIHRGRAWGLVENWRAVLSRWVSGRRRNEGGEEEGGVDKSVTLGLLLDILLKSFYFSTSA